MRIYPIAILLNFSPWIWATPPSPTPFPWVEDVYDSVRDVRAKKDLTVGNTDKGDVFNLNISAKEKDKLGKLNLLGYPSPKNETKEDFVDAFIDLTRKKYDLKLAVLADDVAEITVYETPPSEQEQILGTLKASGGALWNPASYQESTFILRRGSKYRLKLLYKNFVHWVDGKKADVDGVSVFKYKTPPVLVNVNDTTDTKDDIVRKEQKIGTTAWRQWIPCAVKIPESGTDKTITSFGVTAVGETMKFSNTQAKPGDNDAAAANINIALDSQGQGKFWITGIIQSEKKDDAKLQIRKNGVTGDILVTKPMTVFWFKPKIIFPSQVAATTYGTSYGLDGPQQSWSFLGEATIIPTGCDATAPQIARMRLGFIQNAQTTRTWYVKNPAVQAGSTAPVSSTVTVAATRIGTVTWQGYVLDRRLPQSKITRNQTPLYDGYEAFDTSGKSTIINDDAPWSYADEHSTKANAVQGNLTWHALVTYQWDKTVLQDNFLLWLGVADGADNIGLLPNPASVVPICQADWHFHADSSANGLQTPSGGTHKAPDVVPVVTGQTANQRASGRASFQWQDGNQSTNLNPPTP